MEFDRETFHCHRENYSRACLEALLKGVVERQVAVQDVFEGDSEDGSRLEGLPELLGAAALPAAFHPPSSPVLPERGGMGWLCHGNVPDSRQQYRKRHLERDTGTASAMPGRGTDAT